MTWLSSPWKSKPVGSSTSSELAPGSLWWKGGMCFMAALFLSAAFSFLPAVPCCALITPLINTLFSLLLSQRVMWCLRPVPYPVIHYFVPATLSHCPWTYWTAFPISDPAFPDYVFWITPFGFTFYGLLSVLVPELCLWDFSCPLINFPFRTPLLGPPWSQPWHLVRSWTRGGTISGEIVRCACVGCSWGSYFIFHYITSNLLFKLMSNIQPFVEFPLV